MRFDLRPELVGFTLPSQTGRSPALILRQHHAIEHATVTLLSQHVPAARVVARSDLLGFMVYGDVDTSILQAAAEEALARLQAGETTLAVHPNCGTNLVTAGMLTGLAAFAAGSGRSRSLWDRIPSAILGATVALVVAAPLGRWVQANVTTTSRVQSLRITSVARISESPTVRHRVTIGD